MPRCFGIASTRKIGVSRNCLTTASSSEVATFSGGDERQRAIRYADREYGGVFDEIELEPYQRLSKDQIAANFHELWSALRKIREAVEVLAPPGSVPNDEYVTSEPMREAEAIIRGIHAIAGVASRPT